MAEVINMESGISVHAKIFIDPSQCEAFLKAAEPVYRNVIAEPLNISIELFRDDNNRGVFKIVENWNASLHHMMTVQREREYYKSWRENVVPLFIKPQEVEIYSRMPKFEWKSVKKEFYP